MSLNFKKFVEFTVLTKYNVISLFSFAIKLLSLQSLFSHPKQTHMNQAVIHDIPLVLLLTVTSIMAT